MEAIWIVLVVFTAITIVCTSFFYLRFKMKQDTQQTLRLALDKGGELSPDFIRQLSDPEPNPDKDLRRGLIWLAIGLGLIVLAFGVGEKDAVGPLIGSASFPGLVGIAYLVMWKLGTRKE